MKDNFCLNSILATAKAAGRTKEAVKKSKELHGTSTTKAILIYPIYFLLRPSKRNFKRTVPSLNYQD
jgi:hypothetical protein